MSNLPRILVIDDVLGQSRGGRNKIRENWCVTLDLKDVTGDMRAESIQAPVAEVMFCSGQMRKGGAVENDVNVALEAIRKGWEKWPRWALLFLDLHFKTGRIQPEGDPEGRSEDREPESFFGLTVLEHLWQDSKLRDIPVVILSAMKEHRDAIESRFATHGAWDFIDKTELEQAPETLGKLLDRYGLLETPDMIGHSVPFLKALREARVRAHQGNDNILVLGETGTGKELLPTYIHVQSRRRGGIETLFTEGVPETLIEDRLCGHERGGFTDAKQAMPGVAELADRGTLFIDEFGNIPARIQPKLLRLLDKNIREIQRLGSNEARKLDLQIVMATNHMNMFESDDFRRDLLARVKVHDSIVLPPLRERSEDIPLLVEHFVRKYEKEFQAQKRTVSREALEMLVAHTWSDNVRGLEGMIEKAVYRWSGLKVLSLSHLNLGSGHSPRPRPIGPPTVPAQPAPGSVNDLVNILLSATLDGARPPELAGKLPQLQAAYARLVAQLLKAALIATRRPTPKNPEGDILIHPAVKLITGDQKLTASKAADIVKKLLGMHPDSQQQLLSDPILKEAFETALRLRPRSITKGRN